MSYVIMSVGCLCCNEPTVLMGVVPDLEAARAAGATPEDEVTGWSYNVGLVAFPLPRDAVTDSMFAEYIGPVEGALCIEDGCLNPAEYRRLRGMADAEVFSYGLICAEHAGYAP